MMSPLDRVAVAAFPALSRLIDLRDRPGWMFMPKVKNGVCLAVQGICAWPQGFADTFHCESVDDAAAQRIDYHGAVTWSESGTLVEVIDKIVDELISPDDPLAPRLVRRFGKPLSGLWMPRPS